MKKRIIFGGGLLLLLLGFGLGCRREEKTSVEMPEQAGHTDITVHQLSQMLESKDFTLINVHIPYEGEIPGTDLFIPYNTIEQNADKLPADKDAKLVVYCRTASMSRIAVDALAGMGYTNIFNVEGGMRAWQAAGYQLIMEP